MYIKEIRINGFTSYLTETCVSDFSAGVNVVVGRNGAGKSNFFAAIRFVLADLPEKHINELLYIGRGRRAAVSRVEICLADAAQRFLSLGDEVVIAREIVQSTDRFLLNGKVITKHEMRALMDAAGLSSSGNAFFIVPQGQITRLASASDAERLQTLLIASGAQTFEDRKNASLKTLSEATERLEESSRLIESMREHLQQVGRDAENLRDHLELRKQLRGVEHVLLSVEKLRTQLVIAAEDRKFDEQRELLDEANATYKRIEKLVESCRSDAANAEASVAEREAEMDVAEHELAQRRYDAKAAANLAAAVRTSTEQYGDESLTMNWSLSRNKRSQGSRSQSGSRKRSRLASQSGVTAMDNDDSYNEAADESEHEIEDDAEIETFDLNEPVDPEMLADLKQQLAQLREKLSVENKQLATASARLRSLQLKEGRANQLSPEQQAVSRAEAVSRINGLIEQLETSIAAEHAKETDISHSLEKATAELANAEMQAHAAAEEVASVTAEQQIARQQLSEAESARAMALLSFRKAEISRERLEKSAEQQTKQLLSMNSKSSVVRGVRSIRDFATQLNLGPSQYFGTIADLVNVQPAVAHAVDRVVGNQMFYHVVDNSDTVRKLVTAMEQAPPGSVGSATFVPLADVIVDASPDFPEMEGATPLKQMVSVADARFAKVVNLLVGKQVLCQDLPTAMQYTRQHTLPSVTMEGDICDPRGAISGGSNPATSSSASSSGGTPSSRQGLIRELGSLQDQIARQQEEAETQHKAADTAAQRVTQCIDQLNKTKVQLLRASLARQDASIPVMDAHEQVTTFSRQRDDSQAALADFESQLMAVQEEQNASASDSAFAGNLSSEDKSEIAQLTNSITTLQTLCDELANREYALATQCQRLQRHYEYKRALNIQREADNVAQEDTGLHAAAEEAELKCAAAQAEVIKHRQALGAATKLANEVAEKLRNAEDELRQADQHVKAISRKVENHSVKIRALNGLVADLSGKLAELGSIPESALTQAEQYELAIWQQRDDNAANGDTELKHVVKELNTQQKELSRSLAQLGDVNQRAINDYETYSGEIESLHRQSEQLSAERREIEQTCEVLENDKLRKFNAMIEKCQTQFEKIFAKLSGLDQPGKLIINRSNDDHETPVSVGLDVPFGASTAQMSGGQKCLCALSLILAIQACDPAPFYVFDEIDANLDEGARKRVASVVKAISQQTHTQFVCTTFREELVQCGDAWYGVSFSGRESTIEAIPQATAKEFILAEVTNSAADST